MRKGQPKKRILLPDPVYNDALVTRFINNVMWEGKKSIAMDIFYVALDQAAKLTSEEGYEIFKKAVQNVTPLVEVKARRVGGSTYQIPTQIRADRRISLAIKWLVHYARERHGKSMSDKLAAELVAASRNEGNAFKKKEDVHRMAESNKAFAHFK
ncbi:MAG: 30S ribosomal protein S7 [Chitinophagaceae bacterium]